MGANGPVRSTDEVVDIGTGMIITDRVDETLRVNDNAETTVMVFLELIVLLAAVVGTTTTGVVLEVDVDLEVDMRDDSADVAPLLLDAIEDVVEVVTGCAVDTETSVNVELVVDIEAEIGLGIGFRVETAVDVGTQPGVEIRLDVRKMVDVVAMLDAEIRVIVLEAEVDVVKADTNVVEAGVDARVDTWDVTTDEVDLAEETAIEATVIPDKPAQTWLNALPKARHGQPRIVKMQSENSVPALSEESEHLVETHVSISATNSEALEQWQVKSVVVHPSLEMAACRQFTYRSNQHPMIRGDERTWDGLPRSLVE